MKEREKRGLYEDFFDFTARASAAGFPEQLIAPLIDAGAFDSFGMGRKTLKEALSSALQYADLIRIHDGSEILLNKDLVSRPAVRKYQDNALENDENEKSAFGFYFSSDPVTRVREQYGITLPTLAQLSRRTGYVEGFAKIQTLRRHKDRTGRYMAFTTLSDETAKTEMRIFSGLYAKAGEELREGTYIVFRAKMTDDGSLNAEEVKKVV